MTIFFKEKKKVDKNHEKILLICYILEKRYCARLKCGSLLLQNEIFSEMSSLDKFEMLQEERLIQELF